MGTQRPKLILAFLIVCCGVGCDQATKKIAIQTLRDSPTKTYLADTVRLDFAQNPGGFLSLGASLPDSFRGNVFIATNLGMMFGIICFLFIKRNLSYLLFVSLVLVLSGGIGNLIDRICNNGLVTDFINVGIGPLRTGVFNVADVSIVFGAISISCLTFKRDADEQV